MGENQAKRLGAEGRQECLKLPPERYTIVEDQPGSKSPDHRSKKVKESFCISIFWQGIIHPIEARNAGKDDRGRDILEVVAGRKRVRGAAIANGWIADPTTAPNESIKSKAIERQALGYKILVPFLISPEKDQLRRYERMVAENAHRHASSTLANALQLADYLALGGDENGAARVFDVSITTIKNWQGLLQCCSEVQQAVEAGTLTLMASVKLRELDHDAQRKALAEMVASGATSGYAAQEAAQAAAEGKPAKVAQERARLRPRRFIEKLRDELYELRENKDCAAFYYYNRYLLGDDAALRKIPEAVRDQIKVVAGPRRAKEGK